jgi:hypothetical protein
MKHKRVVVKDDTIEVHGLHSDGVNVTKSNSEYNPFKEEDDILIYDLDEEEELNFEH